MHDGMTERSHGEGTRMKRKQPQPLKRQDQLIVRELPGEVLIYDEARDKAFCLNEGASAVWRLCDGKATPRELAGALKVNDAVVWCALDQLGKQGLLDGRVEMPDGLARLTRRQQLKTLGTLAAVAIPLVTAVTAPSAAEAATCLPRAAPCSTGAQCCSGICTSGFCTA